MLQRLHCCKAGESVECALTRIDGTQRVCLRRELHEVQEPTCSREYRGTMKGMPSDVHRD